MYCSVLDPLLYKNLKAYTFQVHHALKRLQIKPFEKSKFCLSDYCPREGARLSEFSFTYNNNFISQTFILMTHDILIFNFLFAGVIILNILYRWNNN